MSDNKAGLCLSAVFKHQPRQGPVTESAMGDNKTNYVCRSCSSIVDDKNLLQKEACHELFLSTVFKHRQL